LTEWGIIGEYKGKCGQKEMVNTTKYLLKIYFTHEMSRGL
jgi:hypothetical protein